MSAPSSVVIEAVALVAAADHRPSTPTALSVGRGLTFVRSRSLRWPEGAIPVPNDVTDTVPVVAQAWRKHPAVIEYVDVTWEDDRLILAPWAADAALLCEVVASGMTGRFARKVRKARPEPMAGELLDAWRAGVPLSYARALRIVPLPVVTEAWTASVPLEYAVAMFTEAAA